MCQYVCSDDRLCQGGGRGGHEISGGNTVEQACHFLQNNGNINVRDEMRRNPQGMVNLARRMFGV
jgi:hypothetical protein